MNIGIFGTGIVGRTLGSRLIDVGHSVKMGSRTQGNANALEWVATAGDQATEGTFEDAAIFGEVLINATNGEGALAALTSAKAENLANKTVLDVTNPLDLSHGFPPSLSVSNTDSLGEQIQRAFPDAHIVKTLNTTNCAVMANPQSLPEMHNAFIAGNNDEAKQKTRDLLQDFGWPDEWIIDLGDITASRGTEAWIHLWLRLMQHFGDANFNLHVVRP
jgi:predicted dinucleotide-binding enzyme